MFRMAGGVAGASVDLILFPLDTIKTRLQSPQGFKKAGGFRGIYAGVPSTAIGSFPNAAAFFLTYEYVKWFLHTDSSSYWMPTKHMLAASAGEVVACLIRVPSEVVKQRAQVSASSRTFQIFSNILYEEGIQGLYRGYTSTVLREIPFSLVQFPLWEYLKALWSWRQDHAVDSWQSAVCGAFAGYSQASSRGWPPSAWGVSSSWVLMTKPAACCPERADRVGEAERHTRFPEERGLRENAAAIAHRGCNLQSARARGCLQLGRRRPRPEQGNRVRGRSLNGLLGISQ
ncbi:PREDICTED: S-adenosylmethionine mitochondrial carrier protein isoform X3 [Chinchilla lanigera]|uniref:S-adenosylmethionine mitochondrial carrier protein isoform X3 n=2 Tax=Chinchilla lanigera TaxID=34839 RepID=UPI000696AC51|nr:PREDICTED: S-adenosylmethionine mitochondrial carrier protein isoform X3 [Chinchilla lanigera]